MVISTLRVLKKNEKTSWWLQVVVCFLVWGAFLVRGVDPLSPVFYWFREGSDTQMNAESNIMSNIICQSIICRD